MHFITYELKRKKKENRSCFKEYLGRWRFTLMGLSVVFSLSTHYFKSNFLSFCFSTLIPNWYVLKWRKTSQKTVIISHKERIRLLYPLLFRIHRNSRTPDVKGITMGRGPTYGDSFSEIYLQGKSPWGWGCYIKNLPTAHDWCHELLEGRSKVRARSGLRFSGIF